MNNIRTEPLVRVQIEIPQCLNDQLAVFSNTPEIFLTYVLGALLAGSETLTVRQAVIPGPRVVVSVRLSRCFRDAAIERSMCVGCSTGDFLVLLVQQHLESPEVVDAYLGRGTSE